MDASQESPRMSGSRIFGRGWLLGLLLAGASVSMHSAQPPSKSPPSEPAFERVVLSKFIAKHCIQCHNVESKKGDLDLESVVSKEIGAHSAVWEKVVRKLSARQMPPLG